MFFSALLIVFSFAHLLYAQDSTYSARGKIIYGYNHIPDSIRIDGVNVMSDSGNTVEIQAGIHKLEAYRNCFCKISKTIEVKRNRIHPVRLKFKHLTTPEYDHYKIIRMGNYFSSLSVIGASALYQKGLTTLLPIGILGLTMQTAWQINQSSRFNHCSGAYRSVKRKKTTSVFKFGINSRMSPEVSVELNTIYDKTFETANTPVGIRRYLKKKVIIAPNDRPLSSYNIFLSYQRQLAENYIASLYTQIFPGFVTRAQLYDNATSDEKFTRPSQTTDDETLFMLIGMNLEYLLFRSLDYSLSFSLGGVVSNTISRTVQFEVRHPSMNYFDENPPLINFDYSYSIAGGSLGLVSDYRFSDAWSTDIQYKLYFFEKAELDALTSKKIFAVISADMNYHF